MKIEKEQELIKDIIFREVMIECEHEFEYMSEEEMKKHQSYIDESIELTNKLNSKLDEDGKKNFFRLMEILDSREIQELEYYFERGVKKGLTDLSYLSKYFKYFF